MTEHDANAPIEHRKGLTDIDKQLLKKIEQTDTYGFGEPSTDIHEAGLEELNRNTSMRGAEDNFGFPKPADDYVEEPTFELGRHPVVLDGSQTSFGGPRSYIRSIGESSVTKGAGNRTIIAIHIDIPVEDLVDGTFQFTGHSFVFTPGKA